MHDEEAATAVEYAVMLLLIFMACLAMIALFGQSTATSMSTSAASLSDAITP
ncbi:MAG: Flp family type IVb pilin [Planctomycetota bacterium]|nr:Flp family type IVb pilin [Planctomycetota bacterium]